MPQTACETSLTALYSSLKSLESMKADLLHADRMDKLFGGAPPVGDNPKLQPTQTATTATTATTAITTTTTNTATTTNTPKRPRPPSTTSPGSTSPVWAGPPSGGGESPVWEGPATTEPGAATSPVWEGPAAPPSSSPTCSGPTGTSPTWDGPPTEPTLPAYIPITKKKKKAPPPPPPPTSTTPTTISHPNDIHFPPTGTLLHSTPWNSQTSTHSLTLPLPSYNHLSLLQGISPNTLAIEFTTPALSPRFALSLAGPSTPPSLDKFSDNTLFHVNPRRTWKGGQVVLNNQQQGSWGRVVSVENEEFPRLFGVVKSVMVIQIREEGFDLFFHHPSSIPPHNPRMIPNSTLMHCYRFTHRTSLPTTSGFLYLQALTEAHDGNSKQSWTIHRVHWGVRDLLAGATAEVTVPGVVGNPVLHPRRLFVSGLARTDGSQGEIDRLQGLLERQFKKYGLVGAGVRVLIRGAGRYAFVECGSEESCDKALKEMRGTYGLTRGTMSGEEAAAYKEEMERKKEEENWD